MAYGICRIKKLKGGSVNSSAQHVERKRDTPNADPEKQRIRIIGEPDTQNSPDLETLVRQRIGDQRIRKNAVLAVEFLLTASPEYFRPNDPAKPGYHEPQRLQDFQQRTCEWLKNRYGDRIVRAELHLDEVTPHIHAYLVPLDEKEKLNCRALFGGREKLSKLQDSFAEAMSPLGLERGIKGSRATHTEIKEYYAAITQQPDLTLDTATIHHQLADRQRALKEKVEMERTAKFLSREVERKDWRNVQLEVRADAEEQKAEFWKKKYQELANQVRDVPLEQVAYELGLEVRGDRWQGSGHNINITGSKFYDHHPSQLKGGGGAIDLVMHVNQYDFKKATAWLKDRFGESAMLQATSYYAREIAQSEPVPKFTPPSQDEKQWQQVREHLLREQKLPAAAVDNLHQLGLIYADNKQNLVSIRRSLEEKTITGASLTGTDSSSNGLARGSKRSDGWFYFTRGGQSGNPIQRAVLLDSSIDAISFALQDCTNSKKTLYLSTDGSNQLPLEFLRSLPEKSVIIATSNHQASERLAHQIIEQLPNSVRKRPKAQDWNEELKNTYNQEQQQHKTEQQQSKGLKL